MQLFTTSRACGVSSVAPAATELNISSANLPSPGWFKNDCKCRDASTRTSGIADAIVSTLSKPRIESLRARCCPRNSLHALATSFASFALIAGENRGRTSGVSPPPAAAAAAAEPSTSIADLPPPPAAFDASVAGAEAAAMPLPPPLLSSSGVIISSSPQSSSEPSPVISSSSHSSDPAGDAAEACDGDAAEYAGVVGAAAAAAEENAVSTF